MRQTKTNWKTFWTTLALGLAALPACAAEAAHEAEASANNPFAGDVGTALWTTVIFLIVVFVLGKFAWGPILTGLQAREGSIREALEKAHGDRQEAEVRLKEYLEKINNARAEATAITEEGRRDGEAVKHRIEADGRVEAEKMLERAKREIDIARDTAIKELYTTSSRLATELAGRILAREIKPQDHERLIAEAIEEIGRQQPAGAGLH